MSKNCNNIFVAPVCKTQCHVNAGTDIKLQFPEYSMAYKHGHQGLHFTAIIDTLAVSQF